MATKKTYKTKFRRRAEGKTNYEKRLALVKSGKVRIAVRKTDKRIIAQAIKYNRVGDETIANADSRELMKFGFYGTNNTPSAYLTGLLIGKRLLAKGEKIAILDIGLRTPSHGNVLFGALKGISDSGISIKHNPQAIPKEDRINATELDKYAKTLGDKAEKMFSRYIKAGIKIGEFNKAFSITKTEIEKVNK